MLGGSGSRPSSRSATRPTSPRTTCSSGGRTTTTTELVLLYVESFGNPRKFGAARPAGRAAEADSRAEERHDRDRPARRELAYGCARGLRRRRRRALPPGRACTRAASLEELIDVATLLSAQPEPRGRASPCSRMRAGSASSPPTRATPPGSSCPRSASETRTLLRELLPAEASVANPVDMLGSATAPAYEPALPVVLGDAQVDAVIVLFVPAVSATADEVAVPIDAAARAAAARSRCSPSS